MEHQGSLPRDGGRCSMPGDHFMALIKFSSGIECLRHRVVASIATMERILTGSWRRFQRIVDAKRSMKVLKGIIQLLSSVLLISPFGIRPPFGYRIFSANSKFRSMLWSMLYPILVEMIRFKEILYIDCAPISISYDFPLVEKCSDDKRWKIVGRKLSRVSTYILRYTGLMLRYQMWNIFMVSP